MKIIYVYDKCIICSKTFRSSLAKMFCKKGVLKSLSKYTGKYLCQTLFLFNKVSDNTCNFIKKETLAQVFSYEFCGIFKNIFFYRTPPVAPFKTYWKFPVITS